MKPITENSMKLYYDNFIHTSGLPDVCIKMLFCKKREYKFSSFLYNKLDNCESLR